MSAVTPEFERRSSKKADTVVLRVAGVDRVDQPARLGYCPQLPMLWDKLTVDEHLVARADGLDEEARDDAVATPLEELRFARYPGYRVEALSGGTRQKRAGDAAMPAGGAISAGWATAFLCGTLAISRIAAALILGVTVSAVAFVRCCCAAGSGIHCTPQSRSSTSRRSTSGLARSSARSSRCVLGC